MMRTLKDAEEILMWGLSVGVFLDIRILWSRETFYVPTILASQHPEKLQQMLNAIVEEGRKYGLELNWDKAVQVQISTGINITRPDGGALGSVREAVYLGRLISCDGKTSSELSWQIGEATGVFNRFSKIWSLSSVGVARNFKV